MYFSDQEEIVNENKASLTNSLPAVLEVAQVVGGQPLYPFRPNPSLSPECQVKVQLLPLVPAVCIS